MAELTVEELQKKIDEMQTAFQKRLNEQKEKYESRLQETAATVELLTGELQNKTQQTQQSDDAVSQLHMQIEDLNKKMAAQENEAARAKREALQARIGATVGLPADFYDLLQGDDEESIAAHAARLAEHLKPATPGNLPRLPQTPAPAFTAEQLNDPAWVRENSQKLLDAARQP